MPELTAEPQAAQTAAEVAAKANAAGGGGNETIEIKTDTGTVRLTHEELGQVLKQARNAAAIQTDHQAAMGRLTQTENKLKLIQEKTGIDPDALIRLMEKPNPAEEDLVFWKGDGDDMEFLDDSVKRLNTERKDTRKKMTEVEKTISQERAERMIDTRDRALFEFRVENKLNREETEQLYLKAGKAGLLGRNLGTDQQPFYRVTTQDLEEVFQGQQFNEIPIFAKGGKTNELAERLSKIHGLDNFDIKITPRHGSPPGSFMGSRREDRNAVAEMLAKPEMTVEEVESWANLGIINPAMKDKVLAALKLSKK